jgi:outer membrane immunogenic protein
MRKFLLGTAALMVLASPAIAADMRIPTYKGPPAVVPAWSWTGCYVGGNVGGLWAHKEWINADPAFAASVGFPLNASYGTHDPNSWIGGVQAGCDYQLAGGFVVGIAGDYDWTDARASNANLVFGPNLIDQSRIKALASVTGRIGYAWDRFLGYVKGGGAWERDDYGFFAPSLGIIVATASETRGGWTVGIGGEYAFTDWLSAFAEYDYYNFGTRTNTLVCTQIICFQSPTPQTTLIDVKETKSVLKVGLNLRWGAYSSVVAKY